MRCKCGRQFEKIMERKCLKPVVIPISPKHSHHGLIIRNHGICSKNHFTSLNPVRIDWAPCYRCYSDKNSAEIKRRVKSVGRIRYSKKSYRRSKSHKRSKCCKHLPSPPPCSPSTENE